MVPALFISKSICFPRSQQIFCDISHRSHRRKVNLSDFYLFIACFQNQLVLTLLSFEKSVAQHNYMIPACATARVILVPIPPSAPVIMANLLIGSLIFLFHVPSKGQFLFQMFVACHINSIHSRNATITMTAIATRLFFSAQTDSQNQVHSAAPFPSVQIQNHHPIPHLSFHEIPAPPHILTEFPLFLF